MKNISNQSLFILFLKDPERKDLRRIAYEFFYLFIYYRELPVHYFSRLLFKKNITNIKDYLPNKFLGKKITPYLNDQKEKEILDNKLFFDLFYRQFDIRIPKILMYNYKTHFVYNNKTIAVKNTGDFKNILTQLFNHYPEHKSVFVKKTAASSCGFNIYKLNSNEIESNPEIIEEIYSEVIQSGYLFQETVTQHNQLTKLNPSCLNTIRIDTYKHDGVIEVISAYIRMSINNAHIDNLSSGGCQVAIDIATGKLKSDGYAPIKTNGVKVFTTHPMSGTIFNDFQIPYFDELKKLAIHAAQVTPGLRIVGWDIAIGEEGPILIEGNSDYDITGNDQSAGGYLAHPVFRKVLQEVKYLS